MEEAKAAAYYDELSRKGEGAARFKQGLGFTSSTNDNNNSTVPERGSALPSSFLNNFVKASSPSTATEIQHQSKLDNIKNKLKKKPLSDQDQIRVSDSKRERRERRRSRSRSREKGSRHRYRSSSRERYRDRERKRDTERRSRSRSGSNDERVRRKGRGRSRSKSLSPGGRRTSERSRGGGDRDKGAGKGKNERNGKVDFTRLIEGYDMMSPAERVKAKMKLQLSETVENDPTKGMGSGWERFEFNKDAPLDDEEIEAAEDDADLVKHIGQSFRFSAVEARKEEVIKAAHDEAMFGVPSVPGYKEPEEETVKAEGHKSEVTSLVSEKVLAKQQGSWRDRVRKV